MGVLKGHVVFCFISDCGDDWWSEISGNNDEKKGESHVFWMWNTSWTTVDMNECEVKREGRESNKYWANCVRVIIPHLIQRVFPFTTMFPPLRFEMNSEFTWDKSPPACIFSPLEECFTLIFSVTLCLVLFLIKKNKTTHNSRPST